MEFYTNGNFPFQVIVDQLSENDIITIGHMVRIKYLEGAHELKHNDKGDWVDLYVYEDTTVKKGELTLVNLGVAMQLPPNTEAWLVPRSSTFKKWGIIQANHIGIIDSSYCGDNDIWQMPVIGLRDDEIVIPKDTRLCQFRIMERQPQLLFESVKNLGNANRGGFGSTGA